MAKKKANVVVESLAAEFEESEKIKEQVKSEKTLRNVEEKLKNVTSKYNTLLKEYEDLEEIHGFVRDLDLDSVDCTPITAKKSNKTSESTAVMVGSDWHAYELVDPRTVGGKNKYNPEIAASSIRKFFQNGLRLVEINRAGVAIPNMVLALLGDLVNGHLREEDLESNAGSPLEEVRFLYGEISAGIDFLLKEGNFSKIMIPCCDGNHGRTTEKIRMATRTIHSNEWMLYHMLEERFSKDKRVSFTIADGIHVYQDIYSYRVRYHHGDAIKYGGGIGGITIPVKKAIASWNVESTVNLDVFGHFHQFLWGGNFVANSSLVGYNPYARYIKAAFEEPSQTFFLINDKRFITSMSPIFVR